jgi:hypothetical protein
MFLYHNDQRLGPPSKMAVPSYLARSLAVPTSKGTRLSQSVQTCHRNGSSGPSPTVFPMIYALLD